MMRLGFVGLVLLAAACGETKPGLSAEHVQMAKACVAGGGEQAHCECQATKLDGLLAEKKIAPEVYKALILGAEGKNDEADAALATLTHEQQFEEPSLAAETMLTCDKPN